eukprot:gb/GECG01013380.1/.p1 GENE.gb/GECG01013380.1/~~gb/GECG01013380.1/.p1  ORF type:complete len:167 (+),score=10.27 gb/GECG01013380.1/:1-501(+)
MPFEIAWETLHFSLKIPSNAILLDISVDFGNGVGSVQVSLLGALIAKTSRGFPGNVAIVRQRTSGFGGREISICLRRQHPIYWADTITLSWNMTERKTDDSMQESPASSQASSLPPLPEKDNTACSGIAAFRERNTINRVALTFMLCLVATFLEIGNYHVLKIIMW